MSKRKTPSRCLVIDASVARAAGSPETKHPVGQMCRDFLVSVRGVCHRMAWTASIKAEWLKHRSAFALQWLASMERLGKLRTLDEAEAAKLQESLRDLAPNETIAKIVLKDCHLIEAALATDCRVASLDDVARGHFGNLTVALDALHSMIWVNPADNEEAAVTWLERGAPANKRRRLKPG